MTTRDDALRRIVYFKELAEHPNTPADEAERARERVVYLSARFSIDEASLRARTKAPAEPIVCWDGLWLTSTPGYTFDRRQLYVSVVNAMGGHVFTEITREPGTKTVERHTTKVYATAPIIDLMKILLPTLMMQMEADHRRGLEAEQQRLLDSPAYERWLNVGGIKFAQKCLRAEIVTWRHSHYRAWAATVRQRILDGIAQASNETPGTGAELVLVDDKARAKQAMAADHPDFITVKAKNHRHNPKGWGTGHADGQRARIGQTDIGTRRALNA